MAHKNVKMQTTIFCETLIQSSSYQSGGFCGYLLPVWESEPLARFRCSSGLFLLLQSWRGRQEWAPTASGPTPCAILSLGPSNLRPVGFSPALTPAKPSPPQIPGKENASCEICMQVKKQQ